MRSVLLLAITIAAVCSCSTATPQTSPKQQTTQQQADQYNQARATFTRAYGACLEGRGYTVR